MTINIPDNLTTAEAIEYAIRAQVVEAANRCAMREQMQRERQAERLRLFMATRALAAA
jgi:hypothetical protein